MLTKAVMAPCVNLYYGLIGDRKCQSHFPLEVLTLSVQNHGVFLWISMHTYCQTKVAAAKLVMPLVS